MAGRSYALSALLLSCAGVAFACSSTTSDAAIPAATEDAATSADASGDDPGSLLDGGSGPELDAGLDAGARSSQGTGGLTCTSQQSASGRPVCIAKIGTVELKVVLPADMLTNHAPLTLALYLHGDGAAAYASNSAAKSLLSWADAHHAMFVSALAPNGCSWWIEPSYTTCVQDDANQAAHQDVQQENAPALDAALTALRAAYDVTNGPVFYYGSSGGSIFLSASFLELYGDRYPGVMALNCGGANPWGPFAWTVADAAERGATKLYFTYGAADEALITGLGAVPQTFADLGFSVDDHQTPGQTQHCVFETDSHGRAAQVWSAYLGE